MGPNHADFILDCPPNPQGLLDAAVVTVLGQIPLQWTPNTARAPLPMQPLKIDIPYAAVSAIATSGNAALAVDGYNDWTGGVNNTLHGTGHGESLWTSTGVLPQSVTLNLGKVTSGIDMLMYLPQVARGLPAERGRRPVRGSGATLADVAAPFLPAPIRRSRRCCWPGSSL